MLNDKSSLLINYQCRPTCPCAVIGQLVVLEDKNNGQCHFSIGNYECYIDFLFYIVMRPLTCHCFLQRVSIACYAESCISHSKSVRPSVCLSVCLSVTRWHWVKTTQATIMGSSLEDSPMTLVSSTLDFTAKFQREHGERGRQMREG